MSRQLAAVIALVCFMLLLGGMCISTSPSVTATPMGTMIDATRHVRDSTEMAPDILFGAGVVVAGIFIVASVMGIRSNDPRKRKYKAD